MGQKTHPYGFRLGVIKTWTSKWYEDKRYQQWLHEDIRIKRAVKDYLYNANVASVDLGMSEPVPFAKRNFGKPVIQVQRFQLRSATDDLGGCPGAP